MHTEYICMHVYFVILALEQGLSQPFARALCNPKLHWRTDNQHAEFATCLYVSVQQLFDTGLYPRFAHQRPASAWPDYISRGVQ